MMWIAILLSMGSIINHLFKILACKQIGNITVHYYAGSHECFGTIWWCALICIILIIIFWFTIWYKLYYMTYIERQQSSSIHHRSIISPYKDNRWYWEFILISRRISIAAFVTFKFLHEDYSHLILCILLIFYLIIHLYFNHLNIKE